MAQTFILLLFSTVITTVLKKTGIINHYFRLKILFAYALLCTIGDLLFGLDLWHYLLTLLYISLFLGAFLACLYYIFALLRHFLRRRKEPR